MALYGDNPLYCAGAVQNAILRQVIYPDWTLRVYAATDVPNITVQVLRSFGAQVYVLPNPGGIWPMAWRLWPLGEPGVERVIVRDADSRINPREKAAVDEWIASGKTWSVLRDHPDHRFWPILPGLLGAKGGAIPDIAQRIVKWPCWKAKLDDMQFIAEELWPIIKTDMMHHSSVDTPHPDARPFPEHPAFKGFCGEIIPVC